MGVSAVGLTWMVLASAVIIALAVAVLRGVTKT
jgi:hypothetical protein